MRVNIGCACLFTYYAPPVFASKARGQFLLNPKSPQTADAPSLIRNDTIAKIYWKQPISARKGEGAEISLECRW